MASKLNPAEQRARRLQKKNATKDGGGKQMKKRRQFASTTCTKHGHEVKGNGVEFKQVRCSIPRTRAERTKGCPLCAESKTS